MSLSYSLHRKVLIIQILFGRKMLWIEYPTANLIHCGTVGVWRPTNHFQFVQFLCQLVLAFLLVFPTQTHMHTGSLLPTALPAFWDAPPLPVEPCSGTATPPALPAFGPGSGPLSWCSPPFSSSVFLLKI